MESQEERSNPVQSQAVKSTIQNEVVCQEHSLSDYGWG